MVEIIRTKLEGVVEIVPTRHGDHRGFFSEVYNAQTLAAHGITQTFVQDNHSFSKEKGVVRGLHYQLPPFAQDKLVRVTRGRAFDVAVDLRKGSPTYGQWAGVELTAEKWNQFLVPAGFAHGFMTLEPNTEFLYKVSNYYSKEHDCGIRFDDPAIGIEWPALSEGFILSAKDEQAPTLAEARNTFEYAAETGK